MTSRKFSSGSHSIRKQKVKSTEKENLELNESVASNIEGSEIEGNSNLLPDMGKFKKYLQKTITINTQIQSNINNLIKNHKGNIKNTLENISILLQKSNQYNRDFLDQFNYNTMILEQDFISENEIKLTVRNFHKKFVSQYSFLPYKNELEDQIKQQYIEGIHQIADKVGQEVREVLETSGLLERYKDPNLNKIEKSLIGLLLTGLEKEEIMRVQEKIYGILVAKFDEIHGYIADCSYSNKEIESQLGSKIARSAIGYGELLDILTFTLDQVPKIYCYAKRFTQKVIGGRGGYRLFALVIFSTYGMKQINNLFLETIIQKVKDNWNDKREIITEFYHNIFNIR